MTNDAEDNDNVNLHRNPHLGDLVSHGMEMAEIQDSMREFEWLVQAMSAPLYQATDRQLLTLLKYAKGVVDDDDDMFTAFMDAKKAASMLKEKS